MSEIEGYKEHYEQKRKFITFRSDDSMIDRLKEISRKTGISYSELVREAVRRLISDIDETGSVNLKML